MKILISENQYEKILLSRPIRRKIKIKRKQLERLLVKEQSTEDNTIKGFEDFKLKNPYATKRDEIIYPDNPPPGFDRYGNITNPVVSDNTGVMMNTPQGDVWLGTTPYFDPDKEIGPDIGSGLDIHDILDILAAISFFIGPWGWAFALGFEAINAILYMFEGDWAGASLSLVFMLLPGGAPLLRRLTRTGLSKISKIIKQGKWLSKQTAQRSNAFSKKYSQEFVNKWYYTQLKKLTSVEKEAFKFLLKHADDIKKLPKNKKGFEKLLKGNKEIWKKYNQYFYKAGKGSKFLHELTNPTFLEKLVYGAVVGGSVYLKNGQIQLDKEKAMAQLEADKRNSESLKKHFDSMVDRYNQEFSTVPVEERDIYVEQFAEEVDVTLQLADTMLAQGDWNGGSPQNYTWHQVFNEDPSLEEKKKLVDIYSKDKVLKMDYSQLANFAEKFEWVYMCATDPKPAIIHNPLKDGSLTQDELENANGDVITTLDSTWKYKLHDGLWYTKKQNNSTDWTLITNCKANSNISIHWEKKFDPDVDTDMEYNKYFKDILKKHNINLEDFEKTYNSGQ